MPDTSKDAIFAEVARVIADVTGQPIENLKPGTSLLADLVLDSLSMYEIVIDLEERFDVQISDSDIDRVETIGDVVDFLVP